MKVKSVGTIKYPQVTVEGFSGGNGTVRLKIEGSGKRLVVEMGVYCVKRMVDAAREVVSKQRSYAMGEWAKYKHLRDYTGYKAPEGQE